MADSPKATKTLIRMEREKNRMLPSTYTTTKNSHFIVVFFYK
jgi:hypothetical protein